MPPMINIGRKMHCPSACTAGTLSAIMAITRPRPMKANETNVNTTNRSKGCARQRHADRQRHAELQQPGGDEDDVARRDRARDQRRRRHGRQPVAAPHATFPLAHHRRRQAETGAAEHADRQQLAHVTRERHAFVAVQHPEREQEDQREQIAVQERHLVPVVQREADVEAAAGLRSWVGAFLDVSAADRRPSGR